MSIALQLRQERGEIVAAMRSVANSTNPSDIARWKEMDDKQELLRQRIAATERTDSLETEMSQVRNVPRPLLGNEDMPGNEERTTPAAHLLALRSTEPYKRDFDVYIRTGKVSPTLSAAIEETRAMGAASGADGATLVPQGFEADLITKMAFHGGMLKLARTITTSTGNPLPWPNFDDTTNVGEWLTEGSGVGSADPIVSNVTLGANLLSSKQVKVSVQLEQDSAFNMEGLLSSAFGRRLGRTANLAYTQGDGSGTYGTITGIVPALVAAGSQSVLAIGSNLSDGVSTDLNSVGVDDFSNLVDKLDYAYQLPTNKFSFHQSTLNFLRKLKDKYGRPVWDVSLAQGEPDTIFGYGFQVNNDLAKIGAGNISVLFGDWNSYVVRNALGFTLVRFNELYMTNYQRAFQAFMRTDAKLLQAAAFSYLIHPLS
jgi:HK97 family phage major capsid protein